MELRKLNKTPFDLKGLTCSKHQSTIVVVFMVVKRKLWHYKLIIFLYWIVFSPL